MKILELMNVAEGLSELSRKELPVRSALKITSLVKKVSDALEAPVKVRQDLIEKYKESEDEQGNIKLKKDKVEQFNKENMELLEQNVDVDFPKIKIEEIEHLEVTPRTLSLLDSLIEIN